MNMRLQLTETQLLSINPAAFQNLCDAYLKLEENSLLSFNKPGSQFGKQKTTSGTPDTVFRRADGSLLFIEHTTKADDILGKIRGDIDSCVNLAKTGTDVEDISQVIFCINQKLNSTQEEEVFKYSKEKKVNVKIIGLDTLAHDICYKYLILAKDYLGIPFDTGQILSITDFVKEYNNKGGSLSTPLDNEFLNREKELKEFQKELDNSDLFIIKGAAGVGKTKIAIEAINNYTTQNPDYSSYVISKKDVDIFEDLQIHLSTNRNYILLIDDANRQLQNFKQIIGVFKQNRQGKIKLVISVREYAFEEVQNQCVEFEPSIIDIPKFTDEEIEKIIKSPSFNIKHYKYIRKIKEISDGNARLAIMAAKLAQKEQVAFLDGDVFHLYDSYFQTFIKDTSLFSDQKRIKVLGLVSFFFNFKKDHKPFTEKLLNDFQINEYEFWEIINELEKMELLECKYNIIRVSEQTTATYFFYKVFIKDELLPLRKLLEEYYNQNYYGRFSESIIASNNLFFYTNEEVLKKLGITLGEYLESIQSDEKKVMEFYSLFWVYKRDEFMLYFSKKIKALPESDITEYVTEEKDQRNSWHKDETLQYLSKVFNGMCESFTSSIELAFEYVRKKPEKMPELVKLIKGGITFDDEDYKYGFLRQQKLFELLIDRAKKKQPNYLAAFFSLSTDFLAHHYHGSRSGRKNTIIMSEYQLPADKNIKEFRSMVWNALFGLYNENPNEVFKAIRSFSPGLKNPVKELIDFDFEILFPFLDANLDVNNFEHVHFVQNTISWISKRASSNASFQALKTKIISNDYKIFRKLDFSTHRGKNDYDFKDSNEFQKLKEADIRKNFVFSNIDQIDSFIATFNTIMGGDRNDYWSVLQSIDIVLDENFKVDKANGLLLLKRLLQKFPLGIREPRMSFQTYSSYGEEQSKAAWKIIENWNHDQSLSWKIEFIRFLPSELVNQYYHDKLMETINSINQSQYIDFKSIERFKTININVVGEVLNIIVVKNDANPSLISLPFHFFEEYSEMLADNPKLLQRAYIQYEKLNNHLDFDKAGLEALIKLNPEFLIDYIKVHYPDNSNRSGGSKGKLGFVWDYTDNDSIEKAINYIVDKVWYIGIDKHPICMFFNDYSEEKKDNIIAFIKGYIAKNNASKPRMNAIFSIVRSRFINEYEELFHHYLDLNKDEEMFKSIMWRGNGGGVMRGDVIFGEIQADDWDKILKMTERHPSQLELLPIKVYLKRQKEYGYKFAERERMEKFTDSFY